MAPDYFDIHSHVSFADFDVDRGEVLGRMKDKNVWSITVGCDKASSGIAVATLPLYEGLFACVGQHPADNRAEKFDGNFYRTLLTNPKVVAVGECGIDYFRIKDEEVRLKEKVRQVELFQKQIELALEFDKPLMIHGRPSPKTQDAYEDILETLVPYKIIHRSKLRGNIHFFAGNLSIARQFIDMGFTLSFTGVITFTSDYDVVIKETPLAMILSETDCPYVTPVPYRGSRNEPIYVEEVVKKIADLKGESFEVVKLAMVRNASRVFGIIM
jgi:TatD DNase family protein